MELTSEEKAFILERRKQVEKEREQNEALNWNPRELKSIPPSEKMGAYDELYASCVDVVRTKQKEGFLNEDTAYYMYEQVMMLFLGAEIFSRILNKL